MAYCDDADMVPFLPSGGLPNPARSIAEASAAGDYFVCDGHGLVANQAVRFRAASGGTLPTGIVAETTYFAIVVSPSRFKVAAVSGGAVVDITTNGTNFVFMTDLPYAAWREWGARQIEGLLPAHVVPIVKDDDGKYPPVVVAANAELAAAMGLSVTGGAEIDLGAKIDAIRIRLKDWVKGLPLRGESRSTQSPVNLAITSDEGATDPRGWATRGNDVIP